MVPGFASLPPAHLADASERRQHARDVERAIGARRADAVGRVGVDGFHLAPAVGGEGRARGVAAILVVERSEDDRLAGFRKCRHEVADGGSPRERRVLEQQDDVVVVREILERRRGRRDDRRERVPRDLGAEIGRRLDRKAIRNHGDACGFGQRGKRRETGDECETYTCPRDAGSDATMHGIADFIAAACKRRDFRNKISWPETTAFT